MADRRQDNDRKILFLRFVRKVTQSVVILENSTAALWRVICWCLLFFALWLMNIPSFTGHWGEKLVFIFFVIGLVYLLRKDGPALFFKTSKNEIDRRIEKASGLFHRPLLQEKDILANPRAAKTRTLWQHRLSLFQGALDKIRIPSPLAFMAEKDPYAIRLGVILLFFIGLAVAGNTSVSRIKEGLTPFSIPQQAQKDMAGITITFSPPEYTGQEQSIFQGSGRLEEAVNIPEGSKIKVRVTDGIGQPELVFDDTVMPLDYLGENTYGLETVIPQTENVRIRQFFMTRRVIPVNILKDTPPLITLNEKQPLTLQKGQLQFDITVQDDHGVQDLIFKLYADPNIGETPLGSSYTETRPVMSLPGQIVEMKPVYDLTWHTWSGLPVSIVLDVTDSVGHITTSGPLPVTLPERKFRHPVAAGLIQERKNLAWAPQSAARDSSDKIISLLTRPDLYQDDIVAFLAMRSASARLYYDSDMESVISVIEMLWDTALRIEEGNISIAARSLREALQALEKTLNDPDASQEEIARAMSEVREAMAAYFMEIAKEMQKNMAENGMDAMNIPQMPHRSFTPQDIQSFLDQLQSEALSGEASSAKEMLSQLQKMMDGLGSSMNMSMPEDMQFMMDGVSELQQLIDKQEELLSKTRQTSSSGNQPPALEVPQSFGEILPFDLDRLEQWDAGEMPPFPQYNRTEKTEKQPESDLPDTQPHKEEQESLRYILGQLMQEADGVLGDIPENMGNAELEMRQASGELARNNPSGAIPHQEKAVEYLRQSQEQMSQQLQARMQQMMMFSFGGSGQTDPLGRPSGPGNMPGWWPGSKVKIPDEAERKKVQEIQKMLRDRSGERNRPDYELEYYKRLLKKF